MGVRPSCPPTLAFGPLYPHNVRKLRSYILRYVLNVNDLAIWQRGENRNQVTWGLGGQDRLQVIVHLRVRDVTLSEGLLQAPDARFAVVLGDTSRYVVRHRGSLKRENNGPRAPVPRISVHSTRGFRRRPVSG